MRYEQLKRRKNGTIRQCSLKEETVCIQYDRPINCSTDSVEYPSGAYRCPEFKEADIDILQQFDAAEDERYSLAWNRDKRKYIIYKNNKILFSYSIDGISIAYDTYWQLRERLGPPMRKV